MSQPADARSAVAFYPGAGRLMGWTQSERGFSVPQSTLDAMDEAAEAISRARRELDAAMNLVGPFAPTLATLLDDDILRLAQRRQRVTDMRASCRAERIVHHP